MSWAKVENAFREACVPFEGRGENKPHVHSFVSPGAVLLVGRGGEVVYHKAFGCRSLLPEATIMKPDTVFDVGSLTKSLVTATLVMHAVDRGKLELDRKLSHIFQTFGVHGKERITVRHLLSHCSGYPAHVPFYKNISKANDAERVGVMSSRGAVQIIQNEIFRAKLDNLPGKVTRYSDIGFILLGQVLDVISGGTPLDKLAIKNIFEPLKLYSSGFIDIAKIKPRGLETVTDVIAPTADCAWRKRIICGEVYDENAWAMGGVAPQAGLFTNAEDIHRLVTELINCWHGRGKLYSKDAVKYFWTKDETVPQSTWALGWDTPSKNGASTSGKYFSESSVGALGFTGCSLWIDPERELDVVLLTNRIHPSVENKAIRDFRPMIHDLIMEELGYAQK